MSGYSTTPFLGLRKPLTGADDDMWGTHWNQNADVIDAAISTGPGSVFLPTAGGAMTGPLYYTATGGNTSRSAQDRAADVANVLDFGADPTGVLDSAPAINAALAAGRNTWLPHGSYLVRSPLIVTNGQELFGDGRGLTTLLVNQTFSVSGVGVISLTGREQLSPCVRDLTTLFEQPFDQGSRANFKTLSAGGTSAPGGTGVRYPPAIAITSSNRFRLYRLRISRAWDGIINAAGNTIGGFVIEDIEDSSLNNGLGLGNSFDFGHMRMFHHWNFDISSLDPLYSVYSDGAGFAARFGDTGEIDGIDVTDFASWRGRVSIANANTWMAFNGFHMDGDNATLEVSGALWAQFANAYFTGKPSGANTQLAQINVSGGNVMMAGAVAFAGPSPVANVTGGALRMDGGLLSEATRSSSIVTVSGGTAELRNISFGANTGSGAWTVPFVNVTGGTIFFQNNRMASASVGDVGGLVIATDSALHVVSNNFWNGWGFTPPGALGAYGWSSNGVISKMAYMLGGATFGSPTSAGASLFLVSAAGAQRSFGYYTNASLRWNVGVTGATESGGNAGSDYVIQRYNDAGALLDTPFAIARGSGIVSLTGGTTIGANTFAAPVELKLASAAGQTRQLLFQTAGNSRWAVRANLTAEGGADSGSDFRIDRFSDASVFIDTPLGIVRSTGLVNILSLAIGAATGPTIIALPGVPAVVQPKGSIRIRTDGGVGATIYVSQGGGTWNPMAGV